MEAVIDKRENGLKGIDELFQSVQEFATSARFKELLDFTAHFKQYAPYNAMLIYIQRPGARFVLPPRWWERYNRERSGSDLAATVNCHNIAAEVPRRSWERSGSDLAATVNCHS